MPNSNFQITNPEALELIRKIKTGEIIIPIKAKLIKYKWFIIGFFVLVGLLTAIAIGKNLSRGNTPQFAPPIIDVTEPTEEVKKKSDFDDLKRSLQKFSVQLPDPAIPLYDNNIDLDSPIR